ncbi:transposase [Stenomitos frigidus]|uniref:Transposase IS116/IS110/IS902 C-terminal domain-containing protein n=1 Tax=Stenomitos frigidus ULC18 TaxID=2107698 RepID=A0A2T1E6A8_9CYAN|nr:transposase [Stenomitos frigidus]PSB28271.1 hypothetical protein C7B82_13800 [Stenomitos frigidus ULC18]
MSRPLCVSAAFSKNDARTVRLSELNSIPGIGSLTAAGMLAESGAWRAFVSARQLAAAAGLTPQEKSSGTSIHSKPLRSKLGKARWRTVLFFPALSWWRWNQAMRTWRDQRLARQKTKRQVLGAVMHKLMRWVFGVLHSGKPFDPTLCFPPPLA